MYYAYKYACVQRLLCVSCSYYVYIIFKCIYMYRWKSGKRAPRAESLTPPPPLVHCIYIYTHHLLPAPSRIGVVRHANSLEFLHVYNKLRTADNICPGYLQLLLLLLLCLPAAAATTKSLYVCRWLAEFSLGSDARTTRTADNARCKPSPISRSARR